MDAKKGPNVTYVCEDGIEILVACNGTSVGNITSYCPVHQSVCNSMMPSSAGLLDGSVLHSNRARRVLSYTATETTCSCPLDGLLSEGVRRLVEGEEKDSDVTVNFVSMLSTITNRFSDTWTSVEELY